MRELNKGVKILLGVIGVIILIKLLIFGAWVGIIGFGIYLVYKFSKKIIYKFKDKFEEGKVETVDMKINEFEKENVVIDVDYRSA